MKRALIIFSLLTLSTAAQAAKLSCTVPVDTPVIESTVVGLSLSADGKQLIQETNLNRPTQQLIVESNVSDLNGNQIIKGSVVSELLCAGSCGPSEFELVVTPMEISPNSTFTMTTSQFNEATGRTEKSQTQSFFICTHSQN